MTDRLQFKYNNDGLQQGLESEERYNNGYSKSHSRVPSFDDIDAYIGGIVPLTDDPTMPTLTFRVLLIGTFWAIMLSFLNTFFLFRTNPFTVDTSVAILLAFPMGKILEKVLPSGVLNPGPFSIKEHVLIMVIASAGSATPYGIENVVTQKHSLYMGNTGITFLHSLGWLLSTQFIGFGIAGLLRRFLVKPKAIFWPGSLAYISLFTTLHKPDLPLGKWTMTRMKFFWLVFAAIYIYTWIPQFLAPVLQFISIFCIVGGGSKVLSFLASGDPNSKSGVGLFAFALDWYYVPPMSIQSPFIYSLNYFAGSAFFFWIVIPALYYNNFFRSDKSVVNHAAGGSRTLNTPELYGRNGTKIFPQSLFNTTTFDLNEKLYSEVQPIYISEMFAINYFSSFAALTAALAHIGLWYSRQISSQLKSAFRQVDNEEDNDIHNELMKAYPEVPDYAYLTFLAVVFTLFAVVTQYTPFEMPIWGVFLGFAITIFFLLPIGIIQGVTGTQIGLNVITEMIIGFIIPGKTVAVMCFKSYSYNNAIQALSLIADLKIGHYMKIAPRAMVFAQLYGAFIGCFVTLGTTWWILTAKVWMDSIGVHPEWNPYSGFGVFFNAGALWGAIGPMRMFGPDSPYYGLLISGFLTGLILPLIPWILNKFYPCKFFRYINIPIFIYTSNTGGYQNSILTGLIAAFIFQYYAFRYQHDWFIKYNYVLVSAISISVALMIFTLTMIKFFYKNFSFFNWIGNPSGHLDSYCKFEDAT